MSAANLKAEFRPTYGVLADAGGNKYMVWYDYAVIKLSSVFESLCNVGLVLSITLRYLTIKNLISGYTRYIPCSSQDSFCQYRYPRHIP